VITLLSRRVKGGGGGGKKREPMKREGGKKKKRKWTLRHALCISLSQFRVKKAREPGEQRKEGKRKERGGGKELVEISLFLCEEEGRQKRHSGEMKRREGGKGVFATIPRSCLEGKRGNDWV